MTMERRDFLYVATLGAAVAASPILQARQQGQPGRTFTVEPDPVGRTIKGPDGRPIVGYITTMPPNTDMTAPSVCCFHPVMTPAGERLTVFGMGHRHYRGIYFGWHTVEFREAVEPGNEPRGGGAGRGGQQPQAAPGRGAGQGGGQAQQAAAGGGQGRQGGGQGRQGGGGAAPQQQISQEALDRQNSARRGSLLMADYWGWGRYAPLDGRIIKNRDLKVTNVDARSAQLDIVNDWTVSGLALMEENLTAIVRQMPGANVIDLTYRFTPAKGYDVVLPEWSFGGLCFSGRSDSQSAFYEGPDGRNDRGNPSMVDGDTAWPDAPWYSRTHVLDGKTAGYGVVNHPSNPPTRWWNPPTTGNIQPSIVTYGEFKIPHDTTLTLRYRVFGYDGEMAASRKNELASEFRGA